MLAESILQRSSHNRFITVLSNGAKQCLRNHEYLGNIRELRNIIEHAVLLTGGDVILPQALPCYVQCSVKGNSVNFDALTEERVALSELEKDYLTQAVLRHKGDRAALAEILGVSERTLYRKLEMLDV